MSFTKSDIIKNIALETSLSKDSSRELLNKFIESIIINSKDGKLKISKFGTFYRKKTTARVGRNPKTGKEHIISERSKLNLIPSRKIKEKIN
tara:strand:+ start:176 stop:451 length:276 start_codon:yes stop_codon:yes gene_type:complete